MMFAMKKDEWYRKAKTLLKQGDFTYDDVAAVLNISPAAVGHKLNGRRPAFIDEIKGIARMLKLSLSELCDDDPRFITDLQEKETVDILRALTPEQKATALKMLSALKDFPPDS